MKTILYTILTIALVFSLAGCIEINPLPTSEPGDVTTLTINEAAPDGSGTPRLTLGMGAGRLTLSPGATAWVEGTVQFDVIAWKPQILRTGSNLSIKQEGKVSIPSGRSYKNDWNLKLGNIPMELALELGAYEGSLDLSGVPLTRLEISDGASKNEVVFNSPNPQSMSRFTYKTGASEVTLTGLANANCAVMDFESGAGSYTLDFSGTLLQPADVRVSSGLSSIKIIIPKGVPAKVTVSGGLNNVQPMGTWTVTNGVYETTGTGPGLTITIDMGVGNLELISR
jgi:hypothetical protein